MSKVLGYAELDDARASAMITWTVQKPEWEKNAVQENKLSLSTCRKIVEKRRKSRASESEGKGRACHNRDKKSLCSLEWQEKFKQVPVDVVSSPA